MINLAALIYLDLQYDAGFGTLDLAQGLAVLAAALEAASRFPPAVAASPLLWGALLKPGAPRQYVTAYSEFTLPQPDEQLKQHEQQGLQFARQRGALSGAMASGSGKSGSRKQREAELRARLLGMAREVVGADITADQPLMEVSCTSFQQKACALVSMAEVMLQERPEDVRLKASCSAEHPTQCRS